MSLKTRRCWMESKWPQRLKHSCSCRRKTLATFQPMWDHRCRGEALVPKCFSVRKECLDPPRHARCESLAHLRVFYLFDQLQFRVADSEDALPARCVPIRDQNYFATNTGLSK